MVKAEIFFNSLVSNHIDFFSGVPDSLLKDMCAYITDNAPKNNHIIAANEGNAVSIAAGYHMGTGKIPMVYMQNSGMGNAVNPLLSLADEKVYNIPMLIVIGWRGEPGVKDEPQHLKQGEVTLQLLDAMQIPYKILSFNETEAVKQLEEVIQEIALKGKPHSLVIRKGTFEKYSIKEGVKSNFKMSRETAIRLLIEGFSGKEIIVSTTGKTSRELFEIREALKQPHYFDFLTVGSMGHSSQIALGIAIAQPSKMVVCIDGDGALIMHMGALAINGAVLPKNYLHIVINNGAHESVGGQPTVGFNIDIPAIARASGYKTAFSVFTEDELKDIFNSPSKLEYPALIEINVKTGSRVDLGRPTISPVENKVSFMKNLQS
ncbi:MAG: phosphonopyruvate decarboxylase [Salinivirgaceae bacterium]